MKNVLIALALLAPASYALASPSPCVGNSLSLLASNQNIHRTNSLDIKLNDVSYHRQNEQATNLFGASLEADFPVGCLTTSTVNFGLLLSGGLERAVGHLEAPDGTQPHVISTAIYAGPKLCAFFYEGTHVCGAAYPTMIDFNEGSNGGTHLGAITPVISLEQLLAGGLEVRLAVAYRDLPTHSEYLSSDIKETNYSVGVAYLFGGN